MLNIYNTSEKLYGQKTLRNFSMEIVHIKNVTCLFATDNDWNPIEWDRAAEELTVERVSLTVHFDLHKKSCRKWK